MGSADQSLRTIRTQGYVRDLRRTVSPNTVSRRALESEVQLLPNHGNADVSARTTAHSGIVERASCAGRGGTIQRTGDRRWGGRGSRIRGVRAHHTTGINSVAERAQDAEHFVMAPPGICRCLNNQVGRLVEGVSGGVDEVIQAAT